MSDISSALHQSDIPCSKRGEIIQRKIKGIKKGGASPRRVQAGRAAPRRKLPFAIDVKGGEIVTLM
jgi:hypothetical protein